MFKIFIVQVAQAAGEFLNAKLFRHEDEDQQQAMRTAKGKKRSPNTPLIRDLVQFFIESEVNILENKYTQSVHWMFI